MAYEQFARELAGIVGQANVLMSDEDRNVYSYDGTSTWIHRPDLIVFPTATRQVAAVLKLANEHRIPVTPRGGGTNVSGGSVPIRGGIVLVMTKMNKILSIDSANLSARVQAGVVLMDLQVALAQERLFFPPDPQSFLGATLGGMIAENAGGPVCLKYGVTKHYMLGLQAVLPTGKTVEFGGSTVKNVVGYDLVSLVTGSEGTLAVVTEAVLRLLPLPPARQTIIALFDDLPKSGATVGRILDAGTVPAKIELLDNWVVRSINRITGMGLPEDAAAMLMFECDGREEVVEHDSRKVIDICREVGATSVLVAEDQTQAQAYWKARSAGFAAVFGAAPTVLAEDVTVPRTRMAEFIERVVAICKKADLEVTVIGHAGDGNLHPSVMTDAKDPAHFQKAQRAVDEIIEAAIEFGGVLSGEHGIGLEKQKFMRRTQDPVFIELMQQIKRIFDPNGILNPGKIWEDRSREVAERLENIRKFQADVEQCMKCGFCGYYCPIYREEHEEKGLARGKDELIRFALEGEQDLTPGFYQAIDNCLLCKTCVQYCPAKTRTDHAVTAARADYAAEKGLPFAKRFVFRHVLPNRRLFGVALRVASWLQCILPRGEGRFRHLPQFLAALGAGRVIPDIAPKFLRRMLPERTAVQGTPKYRVGFFSGCATEYVFPELGTMMVDILRGLDCEVIFDRRQGCCGAPVYFSGDFRTGKKMAAKNIETFDDYDYVVAGCATCSSALSEYATYLAETPEERERFERFAAKVKDFNAFVIDVLAADLHRLAIKPRFRGRTVTWHDPCHLARYQDVRSQPRKILQSLEGIRFVEMPDADRCCGLGGSFSITHYEVSRKIADHKADAVAACGADTVVTACPGCMIQLRDALARRTMAVEVVHIGELFTILQPQRATL